MSSLSDSYPKTITGNTFYSTTLLRSEHEFAGLRATLHQLVRADTSFVCKAYDPARFSFAFILRGAPPYARFTFTAEQRSNLSISRSI